MRKILSWLLMLSTYSVIGQIRVNEVIFSDDDPRNIELIELENIGFETYETSQFSVNAEMIGNNVPIESSEIEPSSLFYLVEHEDVAESNGISPSSYIVFPLDDLIVNDSIMFSIGLGSEVFEEVNLPIIDAGNHWSFLNYKGLRISHIISNTQSFLQIPNDDYFNHKSPFYNPSLFELVQVSQETGFPKSDSSPNAMVILRDSIYRFSGWQWDGDLEIAPFGRSSLYASKNSTSPVFNPILEEPPYPPYSSFFTFQDSLYVIEDKIWSSRNGVEWKERNHDLGVMLDVINHGTKEVVLITSNGIYLSDDLVSFHRKIELPIPPAETLWTNHIIIGDDLFQYRGFTFNPDLFFYFSPDTTRVFRNFLSDSTYIEEYARDDFPEDFIWNPYVRFNDKVYSFFGWSNHHKSNMNDGNFDLILESDDGINFREFFLDSDRTVSARHATYVVPNQDYIILCAGYPAGVWEDLEDDLYFFFGDDPKSYFIYDSIYLEPGFGEFEYDFSSNVAALIPDDQRSYTITMSADSIVSPLVNSDRLLISEAGTGVTYLSINLRGGGGDIPVKKLAIRVGNNAPIGSNQTLLLQEGFRTAAVDLQQVFNDPENDSTSYELLTLNNSVASFQLINDRVLVTENSYGATSFEVQASDTFGASRIVKINLRVIQASEVLVYPNPFSNTLNIKPGTSVVREVHIFDRQGQLIRSYSGLPENLLLNDLAEGIYFVQVVTEHDRLFSKLLKISD